MRPFRDLVNCTYMPHIFLFHFCASSNFYSGKKLVVMEHSTLVDLLTFSP